MMIYELLEWQTVAPVPTVEGDPVNAILGWIIGILIAAIIGIVARYEVKMNTVSTRLNSVIDQSMERMERKNDAKESAMQKMSDMIAQLREILIIAKQR